MDQSTITPNMRKWILYWVVALLSLFLLSFVLGLFDNSTELTPSHDSVLDVCFAIGGLCGLGSGIVAVWKTKGLGAWQRVSTAVAFLLLGFLSVFLVSSRAASLVEGFVDFPAGNINAYKTLIMVSRAYHTTGKGQGWYAQTMPIWSNLDITEDDYNFMLSHRRPGDGGSDPSEISSNGYFCLQVTVEQSGSALRILHAGSQKLPRGSVIICASSADKQ